MTSDLAHAADGDSRPSAVEWWLVAAICLSGFALRAAWPSRLAVEHFDEGVYASNIFFLDDPQVPVYPDQHLYAPPLLPVIIQYAMIFFGASNVAAIAVNIATGSLMVPLVWWVGRRWFGPTGGVAAATLVAFNDVHIFFSRTALTDVMLCFWLLAAVYFTWEAFVTRRQTPLIAAGVTTGLAWWTKYSGWLPLAIMLAGLIPWRLCGESCAEAATDSLRLRIAKNLRSLAGSLGRWGLVAIVAFLVWLPWLSALQPDGGYAAVAANHRGYVIGLSGWWRSLTLQVAKLQHLDAASSYVAPSLALMFCVFYDRSSKVCCTWNARNRRRIFAIGFAISYFVPVLLLGMSGVLAIIVIGGIACQFARRDASETFAERSSGRWLAIWTLTAWFVGLSLTVPLYTPYPRLALPWLTACWLGAGAAYSAYFKRGMVRSESEDAGDNRFSSVRAPLIAIAPGKVFRRKQIILGMALAAVLALFVKVIAVDQAVTGWEARTPIADLAAAIINDVCRQAGVPTVDDHELVIYTYGEPALLFQLRRAGGRLVRPVQDLAGAAPDALAPKLPSFVVIGSQARRTPGFDDDFAKAGPRLELVGTYRYWPSDLVLLDRNELPGERREDEDLEVYQMR